MPAAESLRLGIDVGHTNTDAVVVDPAGTLIARTKVPTSDDLDVSVETAIAGLLEEPTVDPALIGCVTLGAARTTDVIRTGAGLRRVAVLRIGGPLTFAVPPLVTWPEALRAAVAAGSRIVEGGCEFNGERIAPLDEAAIAAFATAVAPDAEAIAITAVFSPVDPADERRAAAILRHELGEIPISMSHEIGSMGLLERENATVLNAALSGDATGTAAALHAAIRRHDLDAECYLGQNDGTQMALAYATRFPVLAIGSGPANSMRGGAHSSGVTDAIVADIGGSSTVVGRLVNGFPCESLTPYTMSGVVTNFRLPDVVEVPIGGGPMHDALCCGGSTPTLTDAAVTAGRTTFGSHPVPGNWGKRLSRMLTEADRLLAEAVDRVGLGADDLPLVVVGGAGGIAPDRLAGVAEVIRPPHFDVANALGAAIAPVSGYAERICAGRPDLLRAAIDKLTTDAFSRAIQAGADPDRVQVSGIEEVPLAYLRDPAVRIKVRATGPPVTAPARAAAALSSIHRTGRRTRS
ncbi:hydantoinase/oxoprolinase N-terminal domain-containing protein (plasmid) [Pseudonocardia bannensis]|uniref:Hydantoinase/oxoprolinase family protein n=1 Tax=Pseudonocardia bannensis TaxID=630973 RepID=A0A848DMQ3_9PSEU|nr:hydantoinase/oxoprolinase N-terminal domain-containing protein [Pseudonocardia bannensis]NMH93813.1 hydantoinase/oxoprolinase family protein [Pseudonocardia bannensis]